MFDQNFQKATEEVIDQLKSNNPDPEVLEDYSVKVSAFSMNTSPLYAERIFQSLLNEDYEATRKISEALDRNKDAIYYNSWKDDQQEEERYERVRDPRVRFIYNTVGEIEGYDWEEAREEMGEVLRRDLSQ